MTNELYYKELSASIRIFYKWARIGRIRGQIKEKYESTRWYADFSDLSLHQLLYYNHYYIRFPLWLRKIDDNIFTPAFKYTGLNYLFNKWQVFCYKQAYKRVLTLYPHLDHCIDHDELVKEYKK